jgi:hypothetical protein
MARPRFLTGCCPSTGVRDTGAKRSPPPTAWAFRLSTARLEVVAVTQQTNARSCKRLESVGMTVVDKFIEYAAAQVMSAVRRDTLSRA